MIPLSTAPRPTDAGTGSDADQSITDYFEQVYGLPRDLLGQVVSDENTTWRYSMLAAVNPYLADNPMALATMAQMPDSVEWKQAGLGTNDLFEQAASLYGMQVGNDLINYLPKYSPSTQRAIFAGLTEEQRISLRAYGYTPPTNDLASNGFFSSTVGKLFLKPIQLVQGGLGEALQAPVIGPTLNLIMEAGDYVIGKPYRTIKQLDGVSKYLALGAAVAGTIATAGLYVPLGGTAAAIGTALLGGAAAGTATSFVASALINGSPTPWINAWKRAYNGEKMFSASAIKRANDLLQDPLLISLATDLANQSEKPFDLYKIAEELVGRRGGGDLNVQIGALVNVAKRYAPEGTQRYQEVYSSLVNLLSNPNFQEALQVLEASKTSVGRDITRAVFSLPVIDGQTDSGWGRVMSGAIDGALLWAMDPLMLAGNVARGISVARYGLRYADGWAMADRFYKIASLPKVQRKMELVAEAIRTGSPTMLRQGARDMIPLYSSLRQHYLQLAETAKASGKALKWNSRSVVDWIVGTDQMSSLMRGIGMVNGVNYGIVKGIGPTRALLQQNLVGPIRDFLRGINDLQLEDALKRLMENPEIGGQLVDGLHGIDDQVVQAVAAQLGVDEEVALALSRMLVNIPAQHTLGTYLSGSWLRESTPDKVDRLIGVISDLQQNTGKAYQLGRLISHSPTFFEGIKGLQVVGRNLNVFQKPLRGIASFVEGITTLIPPGGIHIVGHSAPEEIMQYLDLFRHANVPSYVREAWQSAILGQSTGGARMNAISAFLDSIASATGMRLTQRGDELLNEFLRRLRQTYSLGEAGLRSQFFDEDLVVPVGARPVADMAVMIPIPDLKEVRRAVRHGKFIEALYGIPADQTLLAFQNRFWKPAVLLRLGFVLRNIGEETLGLITRYGFGSMAQEFGARSLAQRNVHERALLEARAMNQQKNLKEFEAYVVRQNWDIPAHMRPVARIIDKFGNMPPHFRVLQEAVDHLRPFVGKYSGKVHDFLENGLGFGTYSGRNGYLKAENRTVATSMDAARSNFQSWWNQVAYGNEYSLRRMIAGGVNPDLVKHAEKWQEKYFKVIMDKAGTSKGVMWQGVNQADLARRLVQGGDGTESYELVHVTGERTLNTATRQTPNQQPWWDSVLAQRQWLYDDPVVAAGMAGVSKVYGPEMQSLLPPEVVKEVLNSYWDVVGGEFGKRVWDTDLHQLWSLLERGTWNRNQFDAVLRRMFINRDVLIERLDNLLAQKKIDNAAASRVLSWAESRNELVNIIRSNFPGQVKPTWSQISDILYSESARVVSERPIFLMRSGDGTIAPLDRKPLAVDMTTGELMSASEVADVFGFLPAYGRVSEQLDALDKMSYALSGVSDASARDWMQQALYNWHADNEWLDAGQVQNWLSDPEAISPFYDNLVDARDEIQMRVKEAFTAPEIQSQLLNNQDWTGAPVIDNAFVLDLRNFKPQANSLYGEMKATNFSNLEPARRALAEAGFEWIAAKGSSPQVDAFILRILDSIENGTPLVVSSEAAARQIARAVSVLEGNGFQIGMRPPIARTWFPKDGGQGVYESKRVFARVNWEKGGTVMPPQESFDIFDFPEADIAAATAGNQLYWDYLDDLAVTPAVDAVYERVLSHIEQNIRAGRRQGIVVKSGPDARPVYRNVDGKAALVEPGERIDILTEPLYKSESLDSRDAIDPANQLYFDRLEIEYDPTSRELLWPILSPVAIDHLEGNLGLHLFELSNPYNARGFSAHQNPIEVNLDRKRLRYADRRHVENTSAGDLPDWEIAQVYSLNASSGLGGLWDNFVNKGFKVFGSIIDAVSRRPIAFHAFALAADRNKNMVNWLVANTKEEADLRQLLDRFSNSATVGERVVTKEARALWGDTGRLIGRIHGDANAASWTDVQAIYYLRGFNPDELVDLIDSSRTVLAGTRADALLGTRTSSEVAKHNALLDFFKTNSDQLHVFPADLSTDGLLGFVEEMFGPGSIDRGRPIYDIDRIKNKAALAFYNELQPKDWRVLQRAKNQRAMIESNIYDYAAEYAVRDLMPFIDSHEVRSQFATQWSGLLPFWYAEENFLKRWAKMFTEGGPALTLARIRKLQLQYLGIREMGIIRQDQQGRDYVVIPLSGLFLKTLERVLPFDTAFADGNVLLQMPTSTMVPGFGPQFGQPAPSPLVGMSLGVVQALIPELQSVERAVVGDRGVFRSIAENIVPTQILNTWSAVDAMMGGSSERMTSATLEALANMDANGQIPDNLTAGQQDEVLRQARRQARIIVFARMLGGWLMPTTVSSISNVEGGSLSWLTEGQVKVPSEILSDQYYELISNMGIEEGTLEYLNLFPLNGLKDVLSPLAYTVSRTESRSGAPLPSTDEAINHYETNWEWYNQYVMAGPWALPQSTADDDRSRYAYEVELIDGMRLQRTPQQFLEAMKYKEGAYQYFLKKDIHDQNVARANAEGNKVAVKKLNNLWDIFSSSWLATHPVFEAELKSGEARRRRNEVIGEMRVMLDDPLAPMAGTDHWTGLKQLQDEYDAFKVAYGQSSLSGTNAAKAARASMQDMFRSAVDQILIDYPTVESYWLTVLKPESGLD